MEKSYEDKDSGVLQGSWMASVCRRRGSQASYVVCSFHSRPGCVFHVQASPEPPAFCITTLSPSRLSSLSKSDRSLTAITHPGRLGGNVPCICAHSHHRGCEAFLSVHSPWNCPVRQSQGLERTEVDGNPTVGPRLPHCCTQALALPRQWLPLVITLALIAGGFSSSHSL